MNAPPAALRGLHLARSTDSPTEFDHIGEISLSTDATALARSVERKPAPLHGFEVSPSFELATASHPRDPVPSAATRTEGPSSSDWSFKMDCGSSEDFQKDDLPACRVIAVSCRLFLTVKKQYSVEDPTRYMWLIEEVPHELIPTGLKHLANDSETFRVPYFHIGWIDTYVEQKDRNELSSILSTRHHCVPVFLEKDEIEGFYNGFCKGVLWPLLHYSLRTKNFLNKFQHFPMYEKVNQRFADAVLKVYRKGDVVWIHDYHLLLTPQQIREKSPSATISFFMHSPFPTVELFRQLPVRNKLLEGMLAADVVGFNTYSHCNHHRSACEALLSIDTQGRGLLTPDGRFVRTHISPAGVNYQEIEKLVMAPAVQQRVLSRRAESSLKGLKIVVGRSRKLDVSQGTLLRLHAFEMFLKNHKEWRGKVVLLEVVDQNAQKTDSHLQCLVQETVGNINGRYGELGRHPPVHLVQPREHAAFTMQESVELYMLAHVLMVTPLRDGLSLVSHEAVACQGDFNNADGTVWMGNKAPMILSEFAGASTALGGCMIVNPHDVQHVAVCRRKKHGQCAISLTHRMKSSALSRWANPNARRPTPTTCRTSSATPRRSGLTGAFLRSRSRSSRSWYAAALSMLVQHKRTTQGLTTAVKRGDEVAVEMRSQFLASQKRLLLLDWDGSIVPLLANREAKVPENVDKVLQRLIDDPRNSVYVMTGRRRDDMLALFPGIKDLGLICEHGSFVRPCGEDGWISLCGVHTWMHPIQELLEDYQDKTPGSSIEVKERSITWHWRNADHDFASWMEKDLLVQLHSLMGRHPFTCFTGRRCVEVHPRGVSKVNALHWLLENRISNADFVLAFGDDKCNEDLFEYIQTGPEQQYASYLLTHTALHHSHHSGVFDVVTPPLGISPTSHCASTDSLTEIPCIRGALGVSAHDKQIPVSLSGEDLTRIKGGGRLRGRPSETKRTQPLNCLLWPAKRWYTVVVAVRVYFLFSHTNLGTQDCQGRAGHQQNLCIHVR